MSRGFALFNCQLFCALQKMGKLELIAIALGVVMLISFSVGAGTCARWSSILRAFTQVPSGFLTSPSPPTANPKTWACLPLSGRLALSLVIKALTTLATRFPLLLLYQLIRFCL